MADSTTAELTDETAVTASATTSPATWPSDVLVEEVSIDGMCGVY